MMKGCCVCYPISCLREIHNIISFGHSFNNRAAASSKGNSKR